MAHASNSRIPYVSKYLISRVIMSMQVRKLAPRPASSDTADIVGEARYWHTQYSEHCGASSHAYRCRRTGSRLRAWSIWRSLCGWWASTACSGSVHLTCKRRTSESKRVSSRNYLQLYTWHSLWPASKLAGHRVSRGRTCESRAGAGMLASPELAYTILRDNRVLSHRLAVMQTAWSTDVESDTHDGF